MHSPRAMKNTPSLLLLLILLTPGPGGSPSPTKALHCPANITISDTNHVASITSVPGSSSSNLYTITSLYVHPEPGFKGVSLVVEVPGRCCGAGSELHEVWFPLEDKCFQGNTEWWLVLAWVMGKNYWNRYHHKLVYRVWTGKCLCECFKTGSFITVQSLSVTGHGISAWRLQRPENNCSSTGILHMDTTHECSVSVCSEPPGTATPGSRGSGCPRGPILAHYCPANITIWGADHMTNIITVRGEAAEKHLDTGVFVHREPGFKGVSLVVVVVVPGGGDGDGSERHDVWFPLEDKCFQGSADWWEMWASALIYNDDNHRLYFRVKAGDCSYGCYKTGTFNRVMILRLTGHGTSGWRFTYPRDLHCTHTWINILSIPVREHHLCKASPPGRTSPPGPHYTVPKHSLRPATPATPTIHVTLTTSSTSIKPQTRLALAIVVIVVVVVAGVVKVAVCLCRPVEETTEATEEIEMAEMRPQDTESSDEEAITVISTTYI